MDARTRKALEDSIAHWERMTADPKCWERPTVDQCPLCDLFHDDHCDGCPVHQRTGACCRSGPYGEAAGAWVAVADRDRTYTPDRRAAMQAEVDFLKSLRPEGDE